MSIAGRGGSGRSGRGRGRGRAPMADINVTPLVDVMLVLLVIFMVTAPLLASAVPIDLPDARAHPLAQQPDEITVSVDGAGRVFVDNSAVAADALEARLAARARGGQPPQVTLRADRGLDYGRVMAVMAALNRAGITQISLVTSGSGRGS